MKSFNEIYQKIYQEKHEELEVLRKKKIRKRAIWITIMAIYAIIVLRMIIKSDTPSILVFPSILTCIILLIIVVVKIEGKDDYNDKFKKEVIENFIKEFDSNLEFDPHEGIVPKVYRAGEFESFNRYHSEDLIKGKLDNKYSLLMSEVLTQDESTDSEGHTHTYTVFHGIFGVVESAKPIPGFLKIHSDKGFLGKIFKGSNKIEMDSSEFEKDFDVYGTDKIMIMQLLTSDIMETLMEFKRQSKIKYELTIKEQVIYIRFHTGPVFEANVLKDSLDFNMLKKYYDIIEFILNVTRKINKTIEETEI